MHHLYSFTLFDLQEKLGEIYLSLYFILMCVAEIGREWGAYRLGFSRAAESQRENSA